MHRIAPLGALMALFAIVAAGHGRGLMEEDTSAHLRLNATSPAADTVITEAPEEVRLWFSESPRMDGTAVRLADAGGDLVPTTGAVSEDEDPRQVFIRPREPLGPGEYTVHWRVIAQDGHAQNGTFGFEFRSP